MKEKCQAKLKLGAGIPVENTMNLGDERVMKLLKSMDFL